jgi:hypothetical protein
MLFWPLRATDWKRPGLSPRAPLGHSQVKPSFSWEEPGVKTLGGWQNLVAIRLGLRFVRISKRIRLFSCRQGAKVSILQPGESLEM